MLLSAVSLCFFISLLTFSLPSASDVSAQSPTATATPRPPLFPSATPQPTLDYSCNGQQPLGYGSVTPDPFWLMNCSQCLTPVFPTGTPQPESTFTYSMTQTAEAVFSPTPNVTPTSIPESYSEISCGSGYFQCTQITPYHIQLIPITQLYVSQTYHNIVDDIEVKMYVHVTVHFDAGIFTYNGGVGGYPPKGATPIDISTGEQYVYPDQYTVDGSGNAKYWYVPAGEYSFVINEGIDFFEVNSEGGGTTAYVSAYGITVDIYSYPVDTGTPTPTPTPVLGYCQSILPVSGDENLDVCEEGIFCMPDVSLGDSYCPIDIPSRTIPLSLFGFDDVEIPSISVCFTAVYFGSVTAWGVVIDIDWIVYVMAGALILRMIIWS
jgi:hypothetical protein